MKAKAEEFVNMSAHEATDEPVKPPDKPYKKSRWKDITMEDLF